MQPLLMMKQTLEASIDPAGPLLLDGPHAKFTSAQQFISRLQNDADDHTFTIGIETSGYNTYNVAFALTEDQTLDIQHMVIRGRHNRSLRLTPNQRTEDLENAISAYNSDLRGELTPPNKFQLAVARHRCVLSITYEPLEDKGEDIIQHRGYVIFPIQEVADIIHVPGLRGNPERAYPETVSGPRFAGTFENYVASIVKDWQMNQDDRLQRLEDALARLGLTRKVSARATESRRLELLVARVFDPGPSGSDLVSVADVGVGVSQVLPVLVALLVAKRGQLVYFEQPELHLHPRAQYELVRLITETASRGVKLVVETHSALLLLHIRTLMAKGCLNPDLVKLHWFSRNPETGTTSIHSADVDENGAFGEWPEDFGDVELMAEGAYLDAVEEQS